DRHLRRAGERRRPAQPVANIRRRPGRLAEGLRCGRARGVPGVRRGELDRYAATESPRGDGPLMARGFQGAMLRGFGARDHAATVLETVWIAPHFVRIRMESPTLFTDAAAEPAAWVRFWFPDPEGSSAEFQLAYTISEADVPAGRFAVDVLLHDPAGPASLWARSVEPGAMIAVMSLMGGSRFDTPDEPPAGYLLIGDSASIPGINGIIGVVPDDVPIEVYLEEHDDNDRLIPLAEHPRLRVHWVNRRAEKSLAAAIENRDWSNWYAWATPEATTLKHVRTRLPDDFGFPKSKINAQAYW